ncbi:alcohol oxidase [Mycena galericulata]|nr:alcohol oxidase [Mycena galericulata]
MWPFDPNYPALGARDVGSQMVLPLDVTEGNAVYDYIVVGGGTAGAVMASRLSQDPSVRVLLLERGGAVDTWASRVPLLSSAYTIAGSPVYRATAEPLDQLDGRTLTMFRGKALGGGSRINGMGYTRSWAADFDRWSDSGRQGWSYAEVEPFFKISEGYLGKFFSKSHGTDGPWKTRVLDKLYLNSTMRCAAAIESLGLEIVDDVNTSEAPAVTCAKLQLTLDARSRRCSTFDAFLPRHVALARRANLKICTNTIAGTLHVVEKRVMGVTFCEERDGEPEPGRMFYARARKEVVLCCGAIGTPQILMLSGMGPKNHLEELGIPVVKDLPGVGSNLQDHFGVSTMYNIPLKDSFHDIRDRPLRAVQEFLKYLIKGDGLFLMPVSPLSVYLQSNLLGEDVSRVESLSPADPAHLDSTSTENLPDIEIMPIAFNTTDTELPVGTGVFSFLSVLLRPQSRGTVRLQSTDPLVPPKCELGFLTEPADRAVVRKGVRISRRIAERMREQGYRMADLCVPDSDDDAALDAFMNTSYRTTFHYSATCRMAPEDDACPGVVDDRLRVHGVQNLRIADCSVFPDVVANHPMAPAVMVAEKCAHMIQEDANERKI